MPTRQQGEKPDQQQPQADRASCLRRSKRTRSEPSKVGFATGPLSDKYGTEDGHPDHEGRTARPKRCLGQSWGHDLTPSNVKDLEAQLGEECRPSLDRLKRRVGLLPLRKRPQDYLTWMLDSSGSSSSSDDEEQQQQQQQQQGRAAKRRRAPQAASSGQQPCYSSKVCPGADKIGNTALPAGKRILAQQQQQQAPVRVPALGCPKCRWSKNGCRQCREKVAAAEAAAAAAASVLAVEPHTDGRHDAAGFICANSDAAGTTGGGKKARQKAAGDGSVEPLQPPDKLRALAAWPQQVPLLLAGPSKAASAGAAECEPPMGCTFIEGGRRLGPDNSDSQHVAVAGAPPAEDLPGAAASLKRAGAQAQLVSVDVSGEAGAGPEARAMHKLEDVTAQQPESVGCQLRQQQQQQVLQTAPGKRRLLGKGAAAAVTGQVKGLTGARGKPRAERLGSLSDPVRKGGGVLGVVGAFVQSAFSRRQ